MCDRGPEPEQQGYCGLCRVLYQDLDQHLSSPQHLDAEYLFARGAETSSSNCRSQSAHILLERFLHDVLKHHPHSYGRSPSDLAAHQKDQQSLQQHEGPPPETCQPPVPIPQITWSAWHRTRRWQQRGDFSSDHSSSTIEQVIRRYCYGQDDDDKSSSVHFSLPISIETQTEWDIDILNSPGQAGLPLEQVETLLEVQVDVEQDYSQQLDWLLEAPEDRRGYLEQPIEKVLPLPQLIPPSFRGKSWAQIEKEDEARVLKLVQQFKAGVRTCYFDSESLARYGCRGYKKETKPDLLPLFHHDIEIETKKRRDFSRAARCQIVKLSRATQTQHVSCPAVATPSEALPSKESAPEAPPPQTLVPDEPLLSGPLPEKYTSLLCPLQRQTSMLYLLCSAQGHSSYGSDPGPSPRRRRRPTRPLGSKVTYRRLPLMPFTVKPFSVKSFPVKPRCVRQLFRSLSPELNTGPAPKVVPASTPRREGLRSCRPPT
ncbi:DBF4-type zinc finger-containing protein 2 [Boleophthalmus pectinirostris]|uniref:DBF4-type zinc finger-containing protein 2 n=1 Tax=Boleophthalmus pectinirostris TaxID=150288 RepID=UPI000A1C7691|nr:DBF4-type zinc finger-containing protein 2 [Boleophthalmus pectinirostris]XP_020790130.1 DBF4-type zinc finger-containing protein 2 [Boleophthalmus pectinirostris]